MSESQTLAKDVKRTDNKRAFQLDGTDRIEWLLPIKARVFNRSRSDGRKWREVPDVPATAVIERAAIPTGELREQLRAEGYTRDYLWNEARLARVAGLRPAEKAKEPIEPVTNPAARKEVSYMAKSATLEKPAKKPKAEKAETGKTRPKFEGVGVVGWLCYMGSKGFSWRRALAVIGKLGLETTEATAKVYVAGVKKHPEWVPGGEKGGAAVTKAARAAFNAIAETVEEVEVDEKPKAKKTEKTATAKLAKKKTKEPAEETEVPADEDERADME